MSHILVVDDEPSIRFVIRVTLESAGHRVVEARHGREALDLLEGGSPPDLITTDYMMPVMNGAELIDQVRRNPSTSRIPLVVVSSSPGAERRTSDADAFIRKPFDPAVLNDRVSSLLEVSE